MPPKPNDVVVTGIGVLAANGIGVDAFWESLKVGSSGITSLENRDDGPRPNDGWRNAPSSGSWVGGPINGFDAAQFVRPRKALKVMGRELQTAFAASQMAMETAGVADAIESDLIARDQVATIFGSQMLYGPAIELLDAVRNSMDENLLCHLSRFGDAAMRDIMPLWMLKYLPNMAACHVGISIGATGPNNTIVAGDVSATSALMESIGSLQRGVASIVVCGATGSRIDETYLVYRGDWPIPTVRDDLKTCSRPHAIDSDGVVGAEAAAALVVETMASAKDRGAQPLAIIAGYASRFMAPTSHASSSNGKPSRGSSGAIILAIQGALASSGLAPEDIGMVVSHGIGDPLRDAEERDALSQTLPGIPICMPVAIAGHSGAALGAVALVTGVLSLIHRTIPATPAYAGTHLSLQGLCSSVPRALGKDAVVVLTHNSHGTANAVVIKAPSS
jgi:3-oxoacyl-[acyl-carrier-protein] synthase II